MFGFISCDVKTALYYDNPYNYVSFNYALSVPALIIYLLYHRLSKAISILVKYESIYLTTLYLVLFFLEYHSVILKLNIDYSLSH
jgi:hypothetical protein